MRVSEDGRTGPPRVLPLAGMPVQRLVERSEELARRWATALIRSRPFRSMGQIPLERLAHEGAEGLAR